MIDNIIMSRLEAQRKKRGKLIKEYAEMLGISERTYKEYKRSGCKLSHNDLYEISKKLGVSIDYLYGIDEQEERQVNDVCKITGLSADAVKRLEFMNTMSRRHTWGKGNDNAYTYKGLLDLESYLIAKIDITKLEHYLRNASMRSFYEVVDSLPDPGKIRDELGAEIDEITPDERYIRFLVADSVNRVLEDYAPQVPPCIYAAHKGITFGQERSAYAEGKGKRYEEAYHRIRGLDEYVIKLIDNKPKSVKTQGKPSEKDWKLFQEITGITKEDIEQGKEGEKSEER